ncbi:hypothetical protein BDN71DRAFT_1509681 [Pleurotus eryngii]|uniref:Uncharacterized protein n=1 Tax=Pleurotus eryngii TaxID=5323 RepID=A0A9P5ZQQ1_PLEER|nr:hypothetical protein BDN71DRAFT_1509681 [Pleurotus eryngii]
MRPDDPNFKQNGGEISIFMVHGGTSETGALPKFKDSKKIKVLPSIIPMKQYPASNSGVQSGDDWSYNIDYTNVMPMFSNGGNAVFDFEASYKEDFVRSKFKQTGIEMNDSVEFVAVEPQDVRLKIDDHPIIGLSVFKCLDPAGFPVTFTFEAAVMERGSQEYRERRFEVLSPKN